MLSQPSVLIPILVLGFAQSAVAELHLNDHNYLETQGLNVLVYENKFHDVFRDQKLGGVEIILHGERIATDGEVRLMPAPEQWEGVAVRAVPFMGDGFKAGLAEELANYKGSLDKRLSENPFGVPITRGTWGGSSVVAGFAAQMYFLHQAFPDVIGTDYTLRGFDYLLGRHPVSNVSYVSSVGTESKLIGYGNNRADYTFIPGGMIPGVVIIEPDFPELKDAWPFLWYENEYVVDAASAFILAANAADALAN